MITTLSLDINSKNDCNNFVITDTSFYNPNLPIECVTLEITPPGCNSVYFTVLPGFSTSYNGALLGLQNVNSPECLSPLPDGIYYIKYSINPNDKIYVEYYYLHNCNQRKDYISKACKLYSSKCDLTLKEYNEKLKELSEINDLMKTSQYLIEYCNKAELGSKLYQEITDKLSKFNIYGKCSNC